MSDLVQVVSAKRVVVIAWAMLFAIVLVFAKDVRQWAQAAETPAQRLCGPVAEAAYGTANSSGVLSLREAVESSVHGFYKDQPLLGSREASEVIAAVPEIEQVNIELQSALSAEQVAAQGGSSSAKFAPTRVLIVGASSIQEGLGTDLERELEKYEGLTVMRFGQYSSGLARPDYFDWAKKVEELKGSFKPDLIIAQFGENDCQGLSTLQGSFLAKFGTSEWDTEYEKRVNSIVKQMTSGGCRVVMIGIPIMRSKSFSQQVQRLNGITEKATEAAGGTFIATWDLTCDQNGKYMASVEFEGKSRMIRAGDGIHLSNHGAHYVAVKLCERLEQYFTLRKKS